MVICESDSAEAVANWALNWNNILDVDVVPVLDDNETRALGKSRETSSQMPHQALQRPRSGAVTSTATWFQLGSGA